MDWIQRAVVEVVMKIWVPQSTGNLPAEELLLNAVS